MNTPRPSEKNYLILNTVYFLGCVTTRIVAQPASQTRGRGFGVYVMAARRNPFTPAESSPKRDAESRACNAQCFVLLSRVPVFGRVACYYALGATNQLRVHISEERRSQNESTKTNFTLHAEDAFPFDWERESANSVRGNTVMCRITTFRSTTDPIYDGGKKFGNCR
jgi:hypothetical protein